MKLYLRNEAAPYLPATKRGSWTTNTSTLNRSMSTAMFSTSTFSSVAAPASGSTLYGRFVSTPFLQGGTIPAAATFTFMNSILSASGVYTQKVHVFVTAGDSDTVRGTLVSNTTGGASTSTARTGRGATLAMADGVVVQAGDRLVMELGFEYVSGTAGSPRAYYGGTGGALTEGSTSTTLAPWVELSSDCDFLFTPPPPPSPAVAVYSDTQGWSSTTTTRTTTVSAAANDLLVMYAATEASQWSYVNLPSGAGLTWTEHADQGGANSGQVALFSAPVAATVTNQVISLVKDNASTNMQGTAIVRVANAEAGVAVAAANAVDNEPNIAITTTRDNSGVVVVIVDWGASDGFSRTWKTVNGFTPSAANSGEMLYFRSAADYTVYAGWYPDVGAIGTHTVGLNTLTVGGFSIAAVEVKQRVAGGGLIRPRPKPAQIGDLFRRVAVHRAANY